MSKTLTDMEAWAVEEKIRDISSRAEKRLLRLYAKRAGRTYNDHKWHYCGCGRKTLPEGLTSDCSPEWPCSPVVPGEPTSTTWTGKHWYKPEGGTK